MSASAASAKSSPSSKCSAASLSVLPWRVPASRMRACMSSREGIRARAAHFQRQRGRRALDLAQQGVDGVGGGAGNQSNDEHGQSVSLAQVAAAVAAAFWPRQSWPSIVYPNRPGAVARVVFLYGRHIMSPATWLAGDLINRPYTGRFSVRATYHVARHLACGRFDKSPVHREFFCAGDIPCRPPESPASPLHSCRRALHCPQQSHTSARMRQATGPT